MSFLHFWAIPAGLATLSVPFIVHWLTKPRPVRLSLSTVRFVQDIVAQRRAVNRLRDWLILLLRAAAIALFALVLARPSIGDKLPAAAGGSAAPTVKVVVLDVSQSLAATSNGIQALERARPIASRHLGYQADTSWNLILAAAVPQPIFERPSSNYSTLLGEVTRARPLPQRLNVQAALHAAGEMLAAAGGDKARRELVVVSDFQRTNWATADFSVLPRETVIQLESVAPAETPANFAIVRVAPQQRIERARPFRLEVDVGNYSPTPRQVTLEIAIGKESQRLTGAATAGGRSTLVAEISLPAEGWQVGEARFLDVDDALPADNVRSFALEVHPQPQFLLLTKQSIESRPSSSYFLERAISPELPGEGRAVEKVTRIDPSRAAREAISSADVLVLDHPGKLSDENLQLIASLLHRGRGVLYVAAEPADATNLKLLSRAAGSGLQLPVEYSPPVGPGRKDLFLAEVKSRQAPFTVFGDEAQAILTPVRFSGGLATRRVADALLDDVLATYNDQTACLVVTACGAGTLAILNVDLGSSNLPSSPAFVPLVGELTGLLLGQTRSAETAASGEPLAVYLPAAASPVSGLKIIPPESATKESGTLGDLHEEAVGVMWQASAAGPPGIYQVRRETQTIFALASAIPPEEADLVTLASDVMTDRLSGGRDVKFRSLRKDEDPRDNLWSWLAVACLGCVLAEVLSLKVFKS
ncbi:MAG: BatA domain-containing protein [Planctomycetia bacterium]|nr:BatA domain-containing protein [Planctomycetia bacterium]